jgi:hypothetical protein
MTQARTDRQRRRIRAGLAVSGLLWLAGCTASVAGPTPVRIQVPSAEVVIGAAEIEAGTSAQQLGIPPGHLPPPGACRVWYPGRPPGHQPRPGPCNVPVPPGAVLVRGN